MGKIFKKGGIKTAIKKVAQKSPSVIKRVINNAPHKVVNRAVTKAVLKVAPKVAQKKPLIGKVINRVLNPAKPILERKLSGKAMGGSMNVVNRKIINDTYVQPILAPAYEEPTQDQDIADRGRSAERHAIATATLRTVLNGCSRSSWKIGGNGTPADGVTSTGECPVDGHRAR